MGIATHLLGHLLLDRVDLEAVEQGKVHRNGVVLGPVVAEQLELRSVQFVHVQVGPVGVLDGGSPRVDLVLGRFGPHYDEILGVAADEVFGDLAGGWAADDHVVDTGVHEGDLLQVVPLGRWFLQVHEGDLVLVVRDEDVGLGDDHVGDLLGDELADEVLVEVDPVDVAGERVDGNVDEQPVGQHDLHDEVVLPLAEHDSPLAKFFFQQLERIAQFVGLFVVHVPLEAARLKVVLLALRVY